MAKKDPSWDNLKKYVKGREKLKNAVLQHPEEDSNSVYRYMKGKVERNMWVVPFKQFEKIGSRK
jgi:hypothetical protein